MGNMSYCRFENTRNDLEECRDALQEGEKMSQDEVDALDDMIGMCSDIVTLVGGNPVKFLDEDDQ